MSSKRRLRRKACTGKLRHADINAAWAHVRRLMKAGAAGHLHVYACSFCSYFHVGHASRAASARGMR